MVSENDKVTMEQLIDKCCEKLPVYDNKVIKEIIMVFLEELRDSIIKNYCVSLRGFFAFRHKHVNARPNDKLYGVPSPRPETMKLKVTFSKSKVLKPLNKYYKDTKKKVPGSLYEIPLEDFK